MPTNIAPYMIHHPNVDPLELPFPSYQLPGGGRQGIYPAVRSGCPPPGLGIGPMVLGMPGMLSAYGQGAGLGIGATAAHWRRYQGIGGYMTGYPTWGHALGPGGMGGHWGGWGVRD